MKPRMSSMAPSIYFHDVLSSFIFKVGKVLCLLSCPCRLVLFSSQTLRKRLQFNSLYSEKHQRLLAKDTDESKDFYQELFVFFHIF